jgi:type II secretory pathway pseudopilin PulG
MVVKLFSWLIKGNKILDKQTDRQKIIHHTRHPELDSGSHSRSLAKLLRNAKLMQPTSFSSRKDARCRNPLHPSPFTLHSFAFTLAEILITLGIIGVIAAMTIPTLLNIIETNEYKTAYKKAYSIATQALVNANLQNLIVPVTGEGDVLNTNNFLAFMDQFKIMKKCINTDNDKCWNPVGDKYNNLPNTGVYAFVDASGVAWSMYYQKSGAIFVDTNGHNLPNIWGKDRFAFSANGEKGNVDLVGGIPNKWVPPPDGWQRSDNYGKSWLLGK